jgi:hypothetical protein
MAIRTASFLLFMLICSFVHAQDYTKLITLAESKYKAGEYKLSAELYDKALEAGEPSPYIYYKAAASWAMAGDADVALDYLGISIDKGFKKINTLKEDPDFTLLHDDSRWLVMLARLQSRIDQYEAGFNRELRQQLLSMQDQDQESRRIWLQMEEEHGVNSPPADSMLIVTQETDLKNTTLLKEIILKHGFPARDSVGAEGIFAAFLILQHSPDADFQKQCIPALLDAARNKDLKYASVAAFQDKLLVKEGKPQIYGTQITLNPKSGRKELCPLENEAGVHERREAAGLPPLAEYLEKSGVSYTPKE